MARLTRLQETMLLLVAAVDPKQIDVVDLYQGAQRQIPSLGLEIFARTLADMERDGYLNPISSESMHYSVLGTAGREYIAKGLRPAGATLKDFQEQLMAAVKNATGRVGRA